MTRTEGTAVQVPRYQWQPSTDEIARRLGIPRSSVVRFDHNTSPFPSDWAPSLVANPARGLNEYPAADYLTIRDAAAKYIGVEPGNVVPTAGIDELIMLASRAFLEPGGVATALVPTYPLYRIATLQRKGRLVEVPLLAPAFEVPLEPIVAAVRQSDLVWLCIPNNPTGNRMPKESLRTILDACPGVVMLDAAYAEIAGDEWGPLLTDHPNLLVGHTLSKGFGLAGLRVGFGIAVPALVESLDGVRPPGSISSISVELAVAALDEPNRMRRRVARLVKERARLAAELLDLGVGVLPSDANFLLCSVGAHAAAVAAQLLGEGLVVRSFPDDGPLGDHLRFTVRSPEEDDRLIEALWRFLP